VTLSVSVSQRVGTFALAVELSAGPGLGVLVGPSGAGKSLTLAMIAGIARPDEGAIIVDDQVMVDTEHGVWVPPQDRRVGMVFQHSLLLPHRSVIDNVALAVRDGGRNRRRREALSWLGEVDGRDWADRRPNELSGGQAQRVALARALAGSPRLLLLDEPFSALDLPVRQRLRALLRGIVARRRIPTLFVTHDPAEAFELADEIHVLEDGRITQSGTVDDIRLRPRARYAAQLSGTNRYTGEAGNGTVTVGDHRLTIVDRAVEGPVSVGIRPAAVSVHRTPPDGSPRNHWRTVIVQLDHIGDRTRLATGHPLPMVVEITTAATTELGLAIDETVWLAVKATEIDVEPHAPNGP
jgi:molybdate transport system ATP-binding protein